MDERRFDSLARFVARLTSRRSALPSLGLVGLGALLSAFGLESFESEAKKKRKRKRKRKGKHKGHKRKHKGKKHKHKHKHKGHKGKHRKKCKSPKDKCHGKCIRLNTNQHCGRCGHACSGGETCRGDVCCAFALCRGECRPDCPPPNPSRPFPHTTSYGAIRPSRGQSQLNADVEAAYNRWKARYLVRQDRDAEGRQVFRIAFGKPGSKDHKQTVSEGQGFGMVIMALMAGHEPRAQEIFDGLWRFRLAHPSSIDPRLMDWKVPEGGGNDSAFDGDADIAYALLLADAQWGSDDTQYHVDYAAEARRVIAGIWDSTIGPNSRLPMLGDWVNPNGSPHSQYTPRTSDFMPGHFRAFGDATGDSVWDDVIDACQDVIADVQSAATGLLPDFAVKDGSGYKPAPPNFLEGPHDGDYTYNAGRDPWRLGSDALLNGDPTSASQASKIAVWANGATGGAPHNLRSGYRLDGTTWNGTDYFTTFFAAPIGVAAMLDPGLQPWLDAIYNAVYNVQEDYYEDTVTLLCLLLMTGNAWQPS